MIHKEWRLSKIPRPRKEDSLPEIISKQDMVKLINQAGTYKQQIFLVFVYSTDLRFSEALNIRFEDRDRIAISKSRFEYLAEQKIVNIIYKDYRNQQDGEPAPLGIKNIEPSLAIDQFLMHVLPAYFQKSRYCGIHASATMKKYKECIEKKLKKNSDSIVALFRLLKALLKLALIGAKNARVVTMK